VDTLAIVGKILTFAGGKVLYLLTGVFFFNYNSIFYFWANTKEVLHKKAVRD
jgi:hypothetical protein